MRPRILIAGDSHVQALREGHALRSAAEHRADIVFFAAPRPENESFRVENGRLMAGSEAAARLIDQLGLADGPDLADFDAVVLVGLKFTPRSLVRLLSETMPEHFREALVRHRGRGSGEPWQPDLVDVPTSPPAVVREQLTALIRATDAHRLATAIASVSRAGIVVMATPFVSSGILALRPAGTIAQLHSAGLTEAVSALFHAAAHAAFGPVADYCPQPRALVTDGFLTPPAFAVGARRLVSGEPHEAGDIAHMNAAFGAACLEALTADILARAENAGAKAERSWPLAPHTHS